MASREGRLVKPLIRAAFVVVRRCQICGRCDAQKFEPGGERDGKVRWPKSLMYSRWTGDGDCVGAGSVCAL